MCLQNFTVECIGQRLSINIVRYWKPHLIHNRGEDVHNTGVGNLCATFDALPPHYEDTIGTVHPACAAPVALLDYKRIPNAGNIFTAENFQLISYLLSFGTRMMSGNSCTQGPLYNSSLL